jgi:hypothetical protein
MHPAMNSDGAHVYWREPKPTGHGALCRRTGGVTWTTKQQTTGESRGDYSGLRQLPLAIDLPNTFLKLKLKLSYIKTKIASQTLRDPPKLGVFKLQVRDTDQLVELEPPH